MADIERPDRPTNLTEEEIESIKDLPNTLTEILKIPVNDIGCRITTRGEMVSIVASHFECDPYAYQIEFTNEERSEITHVAWIMDNRYMVRNLSLDWRTGNISGMINTIPDQDEFGEKLGGIRMRFDGTNWTQLRPSGGTFKVEFSIARVYWYREWVQNTTGGGTTYPPTGGNEDTDKPTGTLRPRVLVRTSFIPVSVTIKRDYSIDTLAFAKAYLDARWERFPKPDGSVYSARFKFILGDNEYYVDDDEGRDDRDKFTRDHPGPFGNCPR